MASTQRGGAVAARYPKRNYYVPDELWEVARQVAHKVSGTERRQVAISEIVREGIVLAAEAYGVKVPDSARALVQLERGGPTG